MKFLPLKLVLVMSVVVGCGSANKNKSTENHLELISNQQWKLDELQGKKVEESKNTNKAPSLFLESEGNRVSGSGGCNSFMGSFTTDGGNSIVFSPMASTRMACPESVFDENAYLKALEEVQQYEVEGDRLVLKNKKGETLAVYVPFDEGKAEIVEKYWKLTVLRGTEIQVGEDQEREPYFILKANENKVNGHTGCNGIFGSFSVKENGEITFSGMGTTLKACENLPYNETDYLKVFEEVHTYSYTRDKLTFIDENGAEIANFVAVYL